MTFISGICYIGEMETGKMPTHKIFKYNENGNDKQLLYSTDKSISDIFVNNENDKIIFDVSTIENDMPIKRIYLLNLSDNTEQILFSNYSRI